MRYLREVVVIVCVLTIAGGAMAGEREDAKCLADMVNGWAEALKAGDLNRTLFHYASTPDVMAIDSAGRVHKGPEGLKAMYVEAFKEVKFLDVKVEMKSTHLAGIHGVCHLTFRSTMETKSEEGKGEAAKVELYVQATWVLKKNKAGWKIAHEHFSPINGIERVRALGVPEGVEDPANKPKPDEQK